MNDLRYNQRRCGALPRYQRNQLMPLFDLSRQPSSQPALRCCLLAVGLLLAPTVTANQNSAIDPTESAEFSRPASWAQPSDVMLSRQLEAWLNRLEDVTAEGKAAALAAWAEPPTPTDDRLDRLLRAVAAAEPAYQPLQADLAALSPQTVSEFTNRFDPSPGNDFGRQVAALWTARQLVRLGRYDEATPLLVKQSVAASPDPATLLFCRAACEYWLLQTTAATETIARLLEREQEIPTRYRQLAYLLEADLATLEADSLDHISRRMRDITRRLDLGHAGPQVRAVQDGVIESLDKLIKKLEDQQQQQQAAGGAGGGGVGGDGRPMEDSQLAGGKGPGEVTSRKLNEGDTWGNLPPRQREEALQQIGREYPAHYREAIEQYFKRLAAGDRGR